MDNCPTGVEDLVNWLPIHPNPTFNNIKFNLKSEYCGRQFHKIEIFDIAGYAVETNTTINRGDCDYNFNVSNLSSGIYFINLFIDDEIFKGKFMKL